MQDNRGLPQRLASVVDTACADGVPDSETTTQAYRDALRIGKGGASKLAAVWSRATYAMYPYEMRAANARDPVLYDFKALKARKVNKDR